MKHHDSQPALQTIASAMMVLFSIQLFAIWMESVYRLGLIKTSMGGEMAGILVIFMPLGLFLAPRRCTGNLFRVLIATVLVTRLAAPVIGVRAGMLVAGLGVAAALVLICLVFSRAYRHVVGNPTSAVGLGVLLSVTLRALGSTYDVSTSETSILVGALLVVATAVLLVWLDRTTGLSKHEEAAPAKRGSVFIPVLGLFANAAIIYLVLSSPGVVSAWTGNSYVLNTLCLAAGWGIFLALGPVDLVARPHRKVGTPGSVIPTKVGIQKGGNVDLEDSLDSRLRGNDDAGHLYMKFGIITSLCTISTGLFPGIPATPKRLLLWNIAFVTLLVGGILLHSVPFPMTPEAPAVVVGPPSIARQIPFYLMLLLSPVVLANIRRLAGRIDVSHARSLAVPVVAGTLFLMAVVIMLTMTNVWGYVEPVSTWFRGKFYLPFLVTGLAMIAPLLLSRSDGESESEQAPGGTAFLAGLLAVVAVLSVVARGGRAEVPALDENRLKILTYNMQLGSEEEGDRNYQDQLAFLREVDANLVGLQESDSARTGGGNVDVARFFADALGYHYYFGPSTIAGTFGTAILSRFPMENPRTIYSYSTKDETGTAVVEVEVNGARIAFFNSHPAGKGENKPVHAATLLEAASKYDYVIAVGDYNSKPDSAPFATIRGAYRDAWGTLYPDGTGPRHPTIGGGGGEAVDIDKARRIDHIFLSEQFQIESAYHVPAPDSETDHPAHWATVTWE